MSRRYSLSSVWRAVFGWSRGSRRFASHLVLSISTLAVLGAGGLRPGAVARSASVSAVAPSVGASLVTASSPSRVIDRVFASASLGREMPVTVFLPPGYDSSADARYPVLYMLHGLGGDRAQWIRDGLLAEAADRMQRGEIQPFIIVLPEGERGYWVDHADGGPRFGSYISSDLVALVDREYRTLARAESRAIGGMSMGGHGALQIALNHPETFHVVGAHSVALRRKDQAFDFFGDAKYFEAHDPVSLARSRAEVAKRLVISIDIGSSDEWAGVVSAFHRRLEADGIAHAWAERAGRHDDAYWASHVADYLRFYGSALEAGTARPSL